MTLETLRAALAVALDVPVALYGFRGGNITTSAAVVGVTGENAYKADEISGERLDEVAVDLYIAGPSEDLAALTVKFFNDNAIPYRLNTTIFERDTNLVHYEYIVQIDAPAPPEPVPPVPDPGETPGG